MERVSIGPYWIYIFKRGKRPRNRVIFESVNRLRETRCYQYINQNLYAAKCKVTKVNELFKIRKVAKVNIGSKKAHLYRGGESAWQDSRTGLLISFICKRVKTMMSITNNDSDANMMLMKIIIVKH